MNESALSLIEQAQSLQERQPTQAVVPAGRALAAIGDANDPPLQARARRVRGLALHYAGRHAEGLAELNRALATCPPDSLSTRADVHPELEVTLSIGVSDDLSLVSHERLLADADTHLYRAKRDGKNRVRWRAWVSAAPPNGQRAPRSLGALRILHRL